MKSIIVFMVYFAFGALVASMANANDVADDYQSSVQAQQAKHANDFLRKVYKDIQNGKEKRQG